MPIDIDTQQRDILTRRLLKVRARSLKPPPRMNLAEWSEEFMYLSPESSSLPGKFSFARVPPQQGVMEVLSDPRYEKVVIMASSQIMKSQCLINMIGYHAHLDPCPIMLIEPTKSLSDTFSKDRIEPLFRDVPVLRGKLKDKRERDSGNRVNFKKFPGGSLVMATAGSPTDLSSRPCRIVLADEIDRYMPLQNEGDPISLAVARQATFDNKKLVLVSSPTDEEVSRINKEYLESDRREYHVPCNACGLEQTLKWSQVKWEENNPKSAYYECEGCQEKWFDAQRNVNVTRGRWIAGNPESEVAGFRISNIYNSFKKLGDLASQFVSAKRAGNEELRSFINTQLGEVFRNTSQSVGQQNWIARLEDYTTDRLPNGVGLITCGVDVQADRLELEVVGWGIGDESWSLEYLVLHGDPNSPAPWEQLDQILDKPYTRQDGLKLKINATAIDLGGTATQSVFEYCRKNANKNVFGVKGQAGQGKPAWSKKFKRWVTGQRFYPVGVDTLKERLYAQLQVQTAGPGYCHFPLDRDEHYFAGLTAETYQIHYRRGFPVKIWTKKQGVANEALDTRVYAMAVRASFNINMVKRLEALDKKSKEAASAVVEASQPQEQKLNPTPTFVAQDNKPPTLAKPTKRQFRPGGIRDFISSL